MKLSGSQPAWSRRAFVSLGVAATVICAASGLRAQQTGQQQQQTPPAGQQPAQADPLKLTSDAAMIVNLIKADKAADFEEVWKTIRTKLSASDKADYKAFADGLKMYKVDAPANPSQGNTLTYLLFEDPNAKVTFDPGKLLYESGIFERADADALYGKLKETYSNILPWPLIGIK